MQSGLKSDNFCGYNQESSPFFWTFMPNQYSNTYVIGEVGVVPQGGAAGSYIRPDIVDVSSFLSGRDDILSKCTPPVPDMSSLNQPELRPQTADEIQMLVPKYTRELRSVKDIDSVDYNRWAPNLPVEPQNLRFVIEDFANERGGFNTRNFVKSSWNNQNNVPNFDKNMCRVNLDPSRACGPECAGINGYNQTYLPTGTPPDEPQYPFVDVTSQQIQAVGASACGPQFFNGLNYDTGSCP